MSEIHSGHRARLTERALAAGLDELPAHEAMEFILYYALPRGDVNPLAHALINKFGSVGAVLHADPEELVKTDGIGHRTAGFLNALGKAVDAYADTVYEPESLASAESASRVIAPMAASMADGEAAILLTDSALRLLQRVECVKKDAVRAAVMCDACAAFAVMNGAPEETVLDGIADIESALTGIGIPLVNCAFVIDGNIGFMRDEWGTTK